MDRLETCLIVSHETYKQYEETQRQLEDKQKQEKEKAIEMERQTGGLSDEVKE